VLLYFFPEQKKIIFDLAAFFPRRRQVASLVACESVRVVYQFKPSPRLAAAFGSCRVARIAAFLACAGFVWLWLGNAAPNPFGFYLLPKSFEQGVFARPQIPKE
jgi:hypothetical protein